jgi:hypothetical protein
MSGETYVVPEITIDPNVGSQKTPRCPKCNLTDTYVTHFAMEKRVCIKCDKDEIGNFNASTIVDGKGLPWRPAKGRVINGDSVGGDGTTKEVSHTVVPVKARKPRKGTEVPRVSKPKAGVISIEIQVSDLLGKSQAEINLTALEGLSKGIGELPMTTINEAEAIIDLRKKVNEIIKTNGGSK